VNKTLTLAVVQRTTQSHSVAWGVVFVHRKRVAFLLFAVLLVGCADTPGGTPTPGPTASETTTGEPPPEPTTPETTRTKQTKPSIELANAPIGGNVDSDGVERCAEVNWLGQSPIPDGTVIHLGTPGLDPEGIFELDQSACPGNARRCADVQWQAGNFKPCHVGARQVANSTDDVTLVIPISATCETEEDCQSLAAGFGGSQIRFQPDVLETPTSETPTSETPSNG
jgi:hypothetical protein